MTTYNFAPNSRYYGLATTTLTTADGQTIVYLTQRYLPSPDLFALLTWHTVVAGERLDTIAAEYMNDPEASWRIADANAAMQPEDLTATPGRQLRITLPQGIPGTPNA